MPLITFEEMNNFSTIAKGYLWEIEIPELPSALSVDVPNPTEAIRLRARSIAKPTRTFEAIVDSMMGLEITDTGAPTYEHVLPLTLSETEEGYITEIIEKWLDLSYDPSQGKGVPKPERVVDMTLRLLKSDGTPYASYKLINAQFSSNGGGDTLSYEDKTSKHMLNVNLLFDMYEYVK